MCTRSIIHSQHRTMLHLRAFRKSIPCVRFMSQNHTHFGYESVTEKEKVEKGNEIQTSCHVFAFWKLEI